MSTLAFDYLREIDFPRVDIVAFLFSVGLLWPWRNSMDFWTFGTTRSIPRKNLSLFDQKHVGTWTAVVYTLILKNSYRYMYFWCQVSVCVIYLNWHLLYLSKNVMTFCDILGLSKMKWKNLHLSVSRVSKGSELEYRGMFVKHPSPTNLPF